jgi:5-methylcytosine-specific restriction protein A
MASGCLVRARPSQRDWSYEKARRSARGGSSVVLGPYGEVVRKPIRPCIEPRCPEYTHETRCEKHKAEFEKARRANPQLTGRRGSSATWRRARGLSLWRHGHRCQHCGLSKAELLTQGLKLEVHHVDGDARNDRQSNLLPLCETCHRVEQRNLPVLRTP